jgi:hypothetical protein
MRMLPVLTAGPAAVPVKITLKVQISPGAMGAVKQLMSTIRKSAAFVPWGTIEAIVRVLTEFRLATVTGTGVESMAGFCDGKVIDVGASDISITFPSRANNELGYPGSAGTMLTELTPLRPPMTATGVTELPI